MTTRGPRFVVASGPARLRRRWYATIGGLMAIIAALAVAFGVFGRSGRAALAHAAEDPKASSIMSTWLFYESIVVYYILFIPFWFLYTLKFVRAYAHEGVVLADDRPTPRPLSLVLYGPLLVALALPWLLWVFALVILPSEHDYPSS
jgi:hypothetical protein